MISGEPLCGAGLMQKIENGAIQVTFDQILVALLASFIHWQRKPCNATQILEQCEGASHKFETRFLSQVEAVARVDNGPNHGRCFDLF